MELKIRQIKIRDTNRVLEIFNKYVSNTFVSLSDNIVNQDFFEDLYIESNKILNCVLAEKKYVDKYDYDELVRGFGILVPINFMPALSKTVEFMCFVDVDSRYEKENYQLDYLYKRTILCHLEDEAKKIGIKSFIAKISNFNGKDYDFLIECGFKECGKYTNAIYKYEEYYDLFLFQKIIK